MKKNSILFLLLLVISTSFTSCSKDEDAPAPATSLEVTVKDQAGNSIANADVQLLDYTDPDNPAEVENGIGTTDSNGKITFNKGLKSTKYFVVTQSPEGTCKYGEKSTDSAIPANQKTSLEVTAKTFGYLLFDNVSTTKSYNVYIVGQSQENKVYNNFTPTSQADPLVLYIGQYTFKFKELDDAGQETDIITEATYQITECNTTQANFGS